MKAILLKHKGTKNISSKIQAKKIYRLQISVLEKVGSYGQGIESIKKEMSMMQDSFGKMVNPILDASKKETFRKTQEYNSEEELPEEIAEEKIYEKQGQKKKS